MQVDHYIQEHSARSAEIGDEVGKSTQGGNVKGQVQRGGRKTGTLNKNTKFLLGKLKVMYGDQFEPVMEMAANAVKLQKIADDCWDDEGKKKDEEQTAQSIANQLVGKIDTLNNAIAAWDKIAKYTTPTLTAIKIDTGEGTDKFVPWETIIAGEDPRLVSVQD